MKEKIKDFTQLDVWKEAHGLALDIYRITKDFPKEEIYALVSQMRRAAYSAPSNIAEGFARFGIKDKVRFYNIAQGSLEELKYFIILSKDLGYIENDEEYFAKAKGVARLLTGLVKSVNAR